MGNAAFKAWRLPGEDQLRSAKAGNDTVRGLDFADSATVFADAAWDVLDDRKDYGEERWQTYGQLDGRLVMIVWTLRDDARHIISMRKCNEREQARYGRQLGS